MILGAIGMIKVSKQFIIDFAQLANKFDWTLSEIEEFKQVVRENPEMKRYLSVLAAAIRAGYEQTEENIHVRLEEWCRIKGFNDIFSEHFNPKELDAMALHDKALLS